MSEPWQYTIEKGSMSVYGIRIDSRHNQLRELLEMLTFCVACDNADSAHLIKSVWYDSNGAYAEIEPSAAFHALDDSTQWAAAECIRKTAKRTLLCFVFLGEMGWGTELEQEVREHNKAAKRHLKLVPMTRIPRRTH